MVDGSNTHTHTRRPTFVSHVNPKVKFRIFKLYNAVRGLGGHNCDIAIK